MPHLTCSIEHNKIGAKGASALAAVLKETQIQKLECAAAPGRSLFCQRPLTRKRTLWSWFECRAAYFSDRNVVLPLSPSAIAAAPSGPSRFSSRLQRGGFGGGVVSRVNGPADTKANNTFPSLPLSPEPPVVSEGEHVPFPEHIPCFGPHNFPTLANAHARSPPHFHTHAMPPSIVRRMDRGHVLLSDGWVARAPAPISAPLRPSPSQLGG